MSNWKFKGNKEKLKSDMDQKMLFVDTYNIISVLDDISTSISNITQEMQSFNKGDFEALKDSKDKEHFLYNVTLIIEKANQIKQEVSDLNHARRDMIKHFSQYAPNLFQDPDDKIEDRITVKKTEPSSESAKQIVVTSDPILNNKRVGRRKPTTEQRRFPGSQPEPPPKRRGRPPKNKT